MLREYKIEVFADYFQIWLLDKTNEHVERAFIFNDQHHDDRVWTDIGMVIMFVSRNFTVPIGIQICDSKPDDNIADWDHVVEASIDVQSGTIEIEGMNDILTMQFHLHSGSYRVRMYHGALDKIGEDGLHGDDHYRIALWPDNVMAASIVLKRWEPKPQ